MFSNFVTFFVFIFLSWSRVCFFTLVIKNPPTGSFCQTFSVRYVSVTYVESDIRNKHKQHHVKSHRDDDMKKIVFISNDFLKN